MKKELLEMQERDRGMTAQLEIMAVRLAENEKAKVGVPAMADGVAAAQLSRPS